MPVYIDLVILLNFLVDFLLLMGANRLCGHPPVVGKTAVAAVVGGIYGGVCLLPNFAFLGNIIWRLVSLVCMSLIAYGWNISALRRGVVFTFLSMALGGIVSGLGRCGFLSIVLATLFVFLMCRLGLSGRLTGRQFVPVELIHKGKKICLTALHDTGNTLKDPVTGAPVLVVAAEVAEQMTGLTREQLQKPVESLQALPGLRLIPYHSIGKQGGLLLALRVPKVRIGSWRGSSLVAFSPEGLSLEGEYQALTGGMV